MGDAAVLGGVAAFDEVVAFEVAQLSRRRGRGMPVQSRELTDREGPEGLDDLECPPACGADRHAAESFGEPLDASEHQDQAGPLDGVLVGRRRDLFLFLHVGKLARFA